MPALRRRSAWRRPDRRALLTLPTTATPRGCAVLLRSVAVVAAVVLPLASLVPGPGVPAPVAVVGTAALAATALLLAGTASVARPALHAALVLLTLLCGLLVLTAEGGVLASAYAGGFAVMAVFAVATCSWAGAVAHLPLPVALLLADRALRDGAWAPVVVHLGLIAVCCTAAGYLVRAAAAAEVDALTGLPNRRSAERHLDAAVARAAAGGPVGVAVIDLDHFKQVNDSRGHGAGDQLLREVADALRGGVRQALGGSADVLAARWGGDEFVVVAPASPHQLAGAVAVVRDLLPAGSTCSAGITAVRADDTPSSALSRADGALYEVKRGTRGATALDLTSHP